MTTRTVILVVMFCHFISAFATLGMPPFFALILEKSFSNESMCLAVWFYGVPMLFMAFSSPFWGKLADRFGKRPLLIRAQLGLSASFLLAGFATDTWTFFIALVLQGVLGGTFAASNAYLATVVNGMALTRSLTAMQWSARAALVAAPICVGLWVSTKSPIELYRYLALLPLLAALLVTFLPNGTTTSHKSSTLSSKGMRKEATAPQIYVLQFAFVFATVITFPYFILHAQQHFSMLSASYAGLLFGIPHLVYLVIAILLTQWLGKNHLLATLGVAYTVLIVSLLGQVQPISIELFTFFRLLMGAAMTAGFIALHALVAGVVQSGTAGQTFGWFESSSKWAAVSAGLCAGLSTTVIGTQGPFLIGAAAIAIATVYTAFLILTQLRLRSQ